MSDRDAESESEPADEPIRDLVGIGLGPFNLGLAALVDGAPEGLDAVFLERDAEFAWHEGMLIEGTTLEVPFLADLVTLADPTSPHSYLNYLRETGRIYEFYFYETFQIPRREYDDYLRWVAERLDSCRFSRRVTDVRWMEGTADTDGHFHVTAVDPRTDEPFEYRARDLALGIGSRPQVPDALQGHPERDVFHTAEYIDRAERCREADAITVVGSGQSAAEVFLDLLEDRPEHGYRLDWLTRSDGFFPMEYSKLGLQHFTPEYMAYVYDLPQSVTDDLLPEQELLYKGIDADTSADIYDALYRQSIGEREPPVSLFAMTEVEDVEAVGDGYRLHCHQWQVEESFTHDADVVVLGTGYQRPIPGFLEPLHEHVRWDEKGRYRVTRDHRLELGDAVGGRIFLQNAGLHTHGVGVPDLGLGAYRNAIICNRLFDAPVYPEDEDTVFQDFAVDAFLDRDRSRTVAAGED